MMSKHKPEESLRTSSDTPVLEHHDDPHRLAQAYLHPSRSEIAFRRSLKFWRDDFWVWDSRRYRRHAIYDLSAEVTTVIKQDFDRWARRRKVTEKGDKPKVAKVTRSLVSNVIQALKGLTLVAAEIEQPEWIGFTKRPGGTLLAVANGLVDLDRLIAGEQKKVLLPHSAAWFSPICLPYAYDPRATCARWLRFLVEMFEGDAERIALVQEWFGYCLIVDTSFQKFLILFGDGANGKTVLLDCLIALVGEPNVSHVPLELFGQRFQLTPTLGKLANVVSEVSEMDRVAEATVKAFVAGDAMYFDRKNQDGMHTRPTARLVVASNSLPAFDDRSRGLWRRLMLLPCDVTIAPDQQDRQLTAKLLNELPGIFLWSVEGLRRLREQRRFTEPAASQGVLTEYQAERNPARAFLLEQMQQCSNSILCGELYDRYKAWCKHNGYSPLNNRQFGKEVQRVFPGVLRHRDLGGRDDDRPYRYVGLGLRSTDDAEPATTSTT
jgi:putative DNA primase/helicase